MTRIAALFLLAVSAVPAQPIRLTPVASGLTGVTDIQSPRDGSGRLFLTRQSGTIHLWRDGSVAATPVLDLSALTSNRQSECGLLGMAFPPGFAEKQYFYVNYTNTGCNESVVARYRMTGEGTANPNSAEVILRVGQPFSNHNGGQLQFGPDGYLYIGFGDGGSSGDPGNRAQSPDTWLGKMLRIDTESGRTPYAIPPSNPYAGGTSPLPEIWASGLRNPWRFSFDRQTGDLWIADVGQNRAEEVNVQPASSRGGENYGWKRMEGLSCYPASANCDRSGLTLPVLEYTRARGDVAITGGYVYRGTRWAALQGAYLYGDYASGRIWGLRRDGSAYTNSLLLDTPFSISTFGQDEAGEIYVADHAGGSIYRVESTVSGPSLSSTAVVNGASFAQGLAPGSAHALFPTGLGLPAGIHSATALPLPVELEGVRVRINGVEAPVYAVANVNHLEQVNFQAPFTLTGPTATVAVGRDGVFSPEVSVPVWERQPGVYTLDGEQALLIDAAEGTVITGARPLRRGETVYFYASGLGPVADPPAAGEATPLEPLRHTLLPVTATIGGAPCEVSFAGLAPWLIGVYQVNLQVAMGVPSGVQQLVLETGGARSPGAKVTVE